VVVDKCAEGQYCCDGVCQDEPCEAAGACCTCSGDAGVYYVAYNPPVPTFNYATEEEFLAAIEEKIAEEQAKADSLASLLAANGYQCVIMPRALIRSYTEYDIPSGVWGRIELDGFDVEAKCCGSPDAEATPLESEGLPVQIGGNPAYPCIGPYTYDVCTDDVSAEDCCGVHHPGEACEDNPCTGACCIPELEPCTYVTGPCPEEGDCGDGFICNEDGNCQGFGNFPIGECPGAVTGDPVPAECQDGLTQSECEATYGTYHPGQTCDDGPCGGECCKFLEPWYYADEFCTPILDENGNVQTVPVGSAPTAGGWQYEILGSSSARYRGPCGDEQSLMDAFAAATGMCYGFLGESTDCENPLP
jgi:hypothetical protein